jgi:hypothetical protein
MAPALIGNHVPTVAALLLAKWWKVHGNILC